MSDDDTFNAETIITLAQEGNRDTLSQLLEDEYSHYPNGVSWWSEFVRVMSEAAEEVRNIQWDGAFDDDPWFVLIESCPHPYFDCWGYCECCGGSEPEHGL
jgi:hypothetical protein